MPGNHLNGRSGDALTSDRVDNDLHDDMADCTRDYCHDNLHIHFDSKVHYRSACSRHVGGMRRALEGQT